MRESKVPEPCVGCLTNSIDTFLVNNPIANHVGREYNWAMVSRSDMLLNWSFSFALACGYLFQRSYWFGVTWLALSVIWFVRGINVGNLDELTTNTLGLNSTPRSKSPFSANRIFVSGSAPN